ncbi:3-oxoacyl-acyl-carrier-protein synthase II, partial [Halorhabdus tiamatea SARL4B]
MPVQSDFDVADEVCVITGGAGVLCSAMARALGEQGATVVVIDIDEDGLAEVAANLDDVDAEYMTLEASVLDRAELEAAAETVVDKYGRIDVLINGAGGNSPEATTDESTDFFGLDAAGVENVFNLNFQGTFLAAQAFGEYMAEQGEGHILNVSSMNAFTPLTKIPAYSGAKAAVSNFTEWL